ncbi:MAG: gamma-glutamyl-gamma-aminobutyrate hydrolase family protein [Actinomycetota bacterium]
MPRPIVGVSGGALTAERQRKQHALRSALHAAGCVPVLLRPDEGAAALTRVHGLVLPGGGDLDPRRYGEEPRAEIREPDPEREEFELSLAGEAVAAGTPVLGICLGFQVLVVALGGRLHQHVPDLPSALSHENATHEVRLEPASRLARIVGAATLTVNSNHHQAPSVLPALLEPVGRSSDGVVEAAEGPGFTVGVGWHPETMDDQPNRRLFGAFVGAALERAAARPLGP